MKPRTGLSRTPARALLVIQHPILAGVVELALNHGQYITRVVASASDAVDSLADWQPHLAVIDLEVDDGEIMNWLEQTRSREERIPVVALTRRGDLKTKLAAFERGADDILTVPFSPEEFVARVLAIMRRVYGVKPEFAPVLKVGELEIDILNRSVRIGDEELHLTSLEQNLLYLLAANAGRPLTRNEILDYLWGRDYAAESNVVDKHVRNLRAKLRDDWHHPRYIRTVPKKGYQFASTLS